MSETIYNEAIVISLGKSLPSEKIAKRKTIVYQTLVDPIVIKVAGQKQKDQLFARFKLFKPKPEEIQFVSINKYYEPIIVISGKYHIDYYRKHVYKIPVDDEVLEVILLNHKFKPQQAFGLSAKNHNEILLSGEERLVKEVKASLIVDKFGQDVPPDHLSSAPSEKKPDKILAKFGIKELPQDTDLNAIRSKLTGRPKNIHRIVNELFEVNERVVIYSPRFRVLFKNIKTGVEKAMEFDGVTAKRIQSSKYSGLRRIRRGIPLPPPPTQSR